MCSWPDSVGEEALSDEGMIELPFVPAASREDPRCKGWVHSFGEHLVSCLVHDDWTARETALRHMEQTLMRKPATPAAAITAAADIVDVACQDPGERPKKKHTQKKDGRGEREREKERGLEIFSSTSSHGDVTNFSVQGLRRGARGGCRAAAPQGITRHLATPCHGHHLPRGHQVRRGLQTFP